MAVPHATYRLQLSAGFDLAAAADACGYLADLGVGALYLSPLLPSMSDHGYDTVEFDGIDAARGGQHGWARLRAAAAAADLTVVLDIVPNHTGVGDAARNPGWWSLLRLGRDSPYAAWFDVDWSSGPILLPVLGDDFVPEQLSVLGDELRYFDRRFPLAPGTEPAPGESTATVHDRQHYRLVNYRRADGEQNYRRFFAVSSLAGLRVEEPAVFAATHAQIARWLREDRVAGLRVDHPDGLADPLEYLRRLRELAGPDCWIVVEKILEPGERLQTDWPVAGTTGYDALAEVGDVFLDPAAEPAIDAQYRAASGDEVAFAEHAVRAKRQVAATILRAEVRRVAALAPRIAGAAPALAELAAQFPVYRSYLPAGGEWLSAARHAARAARPDLAGALDALAPRLADPGDELCVRFQQLTGAVTAKGVEDTAFYRYTRFVALNEVGGAPDHFGRDVAGFHRAQQTRAASAPAGMTTLSTHDTKRGEDVRARLAVLAEVADRWAAVHAAAAAAAPIPDPTFGYLLWQTFLGTGFIARERMHDYARKAMREAARRTDWTDPDSAFERTVHAAVDAGYDDPAAHDPLAELIEEITPYGWSNALGQKLVQLTMPGVPDLYWGTEIWEDTLVDPDNRRSVDLAARRALLAELDGADRPPLLDASGAAKLWLASRTLRARRDRRELFSGYAPLPVRGAAADHALAFDRGGAITVITRLPVGLAHRGGWSAERITLPAGRYRDVLGCANWSGTVALAELLARYPVALLLAQ